MVRVSDASVGLPEQLGETPVSVATPAATEISTAAVPVGVTSSSYWTGGPIRTRLNAESLLPPVTVTSAG